MHTIRLYREDCLCSICSGVFGGNRISICARAGTVVSRTSRSRSIWHVGKVIACHKASSHQLCCSVFACMCSGIFMAPSRPLIALLSASLSMCGYTSHTVNLYEHLSCTRARAHTHTHTHTVTHTHTFRCLFPFSFFTKVTTVCCLPSLAFPALGG